MKALFSDFYKNLPAADTTFDGFSFDNKYTQSTQKDKTKIFWTYSLGNFDSKEPFFNKGHLSPQADFFYEALKKVSNHYINVSPQRIKRGYEVKTKNAPPFKMFLFIFREASEKKSKK